MDINSIDILHFLPFSQKKMSIFYIRKYLHFPIVEPAQIPVISCAQTVVFIFFCNLILFSYLTTFFLHNLGVWLRYKQEQMLPRRSTGGFLNIILIFFIFSSPLLQSPRVRPGPAGFAFLGRAQTQCGTMVWVDIGRRAETARPGAPVGISGLWFGW